MGPFQFSLFLDLLLLRVWGGEAGGGARDHKTKFMFRMSEIWLSSYVVFKMFRRLQFRIPLKNSVN